MMAPPGTTMTPPRYDAAGAKSRVQNYAKTKYGRELDDNEFGHLTQKVNYTGGDVSDDMLTSAYGHIDDYATSLGWKPPAPPEGVSMGRPNYPGGPGAEKPIRSDSCFVAGTPIATPDGDRAIESVRVGDLVLAINADGAREPALVSAVLRSAGRPRILRFTDGRSLHVTDEHPIYDGETYRPARDWQAGDVAHGFPNGTVESLSEPGDETDVFNLTVDGPHTYLANGIHVHNKTTFLPPAPPPQGPPNTSFGPPAANQANVNSSVWAKLNELINRTPGYNPEDPENRMQLDVQRSNSQRSAERRRSAMAERAAQDGTLTTGSFDTTVDGINAARGTEDAAFESQLAAAQLKQQRDETMEALRLGTGLLDSDQTRQLQERLGMLDAAIRREGISSQERLGLLDATVRREGIGSQERLGRGDLRGRLLDILLRNQQSNDRLGFDYTQLESLMNQALLGMFR